MPVIFLAACSSRAAPAASAPTSPAQSPQVSPGVAETAGPVAYPTSASPPASQIPTGGPSALPHCPTPPYAFNQEVIAFSSDDIFVVNADGSGLRQLTGAEYRQSTQPAWSPNGLALAFASSRYSSSAGDFDIFTIGNSGLNPKRITSDAGSEEHPAWSPNGNTIAFEAITETRSRIELVGASGTPRTLVPSPRTWNALPSWSPKGDMIAFFGTNQFAAGGWDLLLHDLTSHETRLLSTTPDITSSDATPWSPNGKQLVFAASKAGNNDIFVIDLETGVRTQLTDDPSEEFQPMWSSMGDRIAFVSTRGGYPGLYVMNADGTDQLRLTSGPGEAFDPRWSPDDRLIAYFAVTDQRYEIVVIDDNGCVVSHPTREVSDLVDVPVWAPAMNSSE